MCEALDMNGVNVYLAVTHPSANQDANVCIHLLIQHRHRAHTRLWALYYKGQAELVSLGQE
jgi:hypothetical protein